MEALCLVKNSTVMVYVLLKMKR